MTSFADPAFFGEQWADDYDERTPRDPGPEVDFLAPLAADGPVLEFAVGTGRVALPLAASGIAVEGVEASAAMVERMRTKPGFNTLFNLTSQERQVDCFRGLARVLAPGGVFVVEAFIPDPERWVDGQRLDVYEVGERSVLLS